VRSFLRGKKQIAQFPLTKVYLSKMTLATAGGECLISKQFVKIAAISNAVAQRSRKGTTAGLGALLKSSRRGPTGSCQSSRETIASSPSTGRCSKNEP
jgi:hypothetical protein